MNYRNSGLEVKSYRYYDTKTCGFDAAGAYEDLNVSQPTQLTQLYISVHILVYGIDFLSFVTSCRVGLRILTSCK